MRGGTAEPAVPDHERGRQVQQRLGRHERDLPAGRHRAAAQQHRELLPRLARRQLQVVREIGHAREATPGSHGRTVPISAASSRPARHAREARRLSDLRSGGGPRDGHVRQPGWHRARGHGVVEWLRVCMAARQRHCQAPPGTEGDGPPVTQSLGVTQTGAIPTKRPGTGQTVRLVAACQAAARSGLPTVARSAGAAW